MQLVVLYYVELEKEEVNVACQVVHTLNAGHKEQRKMAGRAPGRRSVESPLVFSTFLRPDSIYQL